MHIISHLFPFSLQFEDTDLSKPHDNIYLHNWNNMITILDIQRLSFTSEVKYIHSEPPQNNEVAKAYWFKFISSDESQSFSSLHFLHVDLPQSDRIGS